MQVLSQKDTFITSLSPLDRQIRVGSRVPISEKAALKHIAGQALNWQINELHRLHSIVKQLAVKLTNFPLNLPSKIGLIKTTGKEEAHAAHCRQNSIVLPQRVLQQRDKQLEFLLAHELFHILSRNNKALRQRLYAVIGFELCEPMQITPPLAQRQITNPDAPNEHYRIRLKHNDRTIQVMPILLWKTETNKLDKQRGLFDSLEAGWLEVIPNNRSWRVVEHQGEPVIHTFADLPALQRKIGRNTTYVIHPEEILADNFAHLIMQTKNLPDPQIVQEMTKLFLRHE